MSRVHDRWTIDDLELIALREEAFWHRVQADAIELGQRYVPAPSVLPEGAKYGWWCIADSQLEKIVVSGLTFGVAHSKSKELSELDKHNPSR